MNPSPQYKIVGLEYQNTHCRVDFKDMWSYRALTRKVPTFGLMLCWCSLEILNNVVVELVCCKWSLMGQWRCPWAEDIHAVCVSAVSCHSIATIHSRCSMNIDFQGAHDVWEFKATHSLLLVLSKQGTDSPKGCTFCSNQNWLRMQKKGSGVMRNTNNQGTLLYSFLLKLLPCVSYSAENGDRRKKIEQPVIPFHFSVFSLVNKLKLESVDKMCMY